MAPDDMDRQTVHAICEVVNLAIPETSFLGLLQVSADPEYLRKVSSKDRPRFDDPAAGDLDAMPQVAGYQYPDV